MAIKREKTTEELSVFNSRCSAVTDGCGNIANPVVKTDEIKPRVSAELKRRYKATKKKLG